ncbi:hypothetical protein GKZ90_0005845 [Flavobacterium sp. MC2016-06]|uniref:hypothetical protein n=1 Tax=Flavobacterium sp. MC2016-06 TaxID=2676308 RepID=UPI0012BA8A68|nr:hypothetical protein [Flavobacterium sp. MC2016-06]MBU3857660.1 hypothetical protein [Flavobacterium sp. MC2016-06]
MKYQLIRTCKDCKNEDAFEFTKIQSAFKLYDSNEIWKKNCSKCNSLNCSSLHHPFVKLDKEVLDIWGNDEKLYLNPQDEEIILAEMHYLPIILTAINEGKYLNSKINVLIESICILLYDNTVICNDFSKQENKEREKNAKIILPELIKIKNKIKESEENIMEYIKVVVFPQIEIK